MNRFLLLLALGATLSHATLLAQPPRQFPTIGQVVRYDARFDQLVPKDAKIEVLASGFQWAEGPVWVKPDADRPNVVGKEGFLLFSDVPQNTIFKWTDKEGLTTFLKPSGYTGVGRYSNEPGSNGLTLDRQGRLVSAEHGDRRISAMPLAGGGKVTLAATYQGKRFNSPNDVVQHSSGAYYFTDPPYGLPRQEKDSTRETPVFGVYRIAPTGEVSLVIDNLERPNGVAFSPDEQTLYVAQSTGAMLIYAYPLRADGSVGPGRVFYDAKALSKQGLRGAPDGIKVDQQGNVWSTGPGGVLVISKDGTLLGRIDPGEATANCAWGDDGATLYMTSDMFLCRIRTTARGVY